MGIVSVLSIRLERTLSLSPVGSVSSQQRVAIARARASSAWIILADELTGNLDTENGRLVIDLLHSLVKDKGYCVIVVTHDPGIAAGADVVYQMQDGHIISRKEQK